MTAPRRRWSYSLRTLFVVVTVAGLIAGWLNWRSKALAELIERDREWRAAMAGGRFSDAYSMASTGFQRSTTLQSFTAIYRGSVTADFDPPDLVYVDIFGGGEVWDERDSSDPFVVGGFGVYWVREGGKWRKTGESFHYSD